MKGKGVAQKGQNKAVQLVHTGTHTCSHSLHANTMHQRAQPQGLGKPQTVPSVHTPKTKGLIGRERTVSL